MGSATGPATAPDWTAEGEQANGRFGHIVGTAGDVNGDGTPDLLISEPRYDNGETDEGRVLVYHTTPAGNGEWSQSDKLTASDAGNGDLFGWGLDLDGNTAVIGSRREDEAATNAGSAYIMVNSGGAWSEEAKLLASDAGGNDQLGYSAAIDGDTVILGAPFDDDNGSDSGSAYIFTRSGTTWTQEAKLTASEGAAGERFG